MKYVKVMFGNKGAGFKYKIDKVNISNVWNPTMQNDPIKMGGFNFTTEDKMIRWLSRGDTIYDIIIPDDAEIIDVVDSATPHGLFRSNKIIPTNPRKVTDEMAMHFYEISVIPKKSYYKSLAACALMGYDKTAKRIFREKVSKENIDTVIEEWLAFIERGKKDNQNDTVKYVDEALKEIKSDLLISLTVDKEPFVKKITSDNVINLTGQSGSGKSFFAKQYNHDKYLVIDTDDIFSDSRFEESKGINKELGSMFRKKYEQLPSIVNDFDLIYQDILNYCQSIDKIIVIDCAQFHCIKNINLLKGTIVIMRTCIDTCYNRCIERYKKNNPIYTKEEINKYQEKKKSIYIWYKTTNKFLERINILP